MTITIKIDMDNAAFEENSGAEVSRILQRLQSDIDERDLLPGETFNLRDFNGNAVGKAVVR